MHHMSAGVDVSKSKTENLPLTTCECGDGYKVINYPLYYFPRNQRRKKFGVSISQ